MNKLIKSSAVATLLGALACTASAQSAVAVSGIIDTGVMSANHVGDGTQSKFSTANSILGVSNLGLSGKEELGNGLSVIFQLQAGFNPTSGAQSSTGSLFSRNSYVGVKSNFGTVTLGKQWNFNDDWLIGSVFKGGYNSGAIFKFSEFDAVSEIYNNTIKYVSPAINGLQGGLMYSAGENVAGSSVGNVYNIAIKYAQGPFYMAASYDHEKDMAALNNTGNPYKLATIGASYTIGAARGRLGYAHSDIGGPGSFQSIPSLSARKAHVIGVGVDYDVLPAMTVSADVLYRKNTTLSNSTHVYRLLGVYKLSPRTSLIANLAYLGNKSGASEALINTTSTAAGGGFADQTQNALALGIRHAF
jgi:predicted porin